MKVAKPDIREVLDIAADIGFKSVLLRYKLTEAIKALLEVKSLCAVDLHK